MARRRSQAIRKPQESPEQIERRIVAERTSAIGLTVPALRLVEMVPATVRLETHGERGGGKTVKRLDEIGKLMRQHLLTARQFAAAEHFAERYQTAGLNAGRAQNYGTCASAGTSSVLPDGLHAMKARQQLDMIRTYLGRDDERLLVRVCVLGQTLGARGTGAERSRHASALAWLCKALDRVASAVRL